MHRRRPVALTGAERRALRVIEETLTDEDPGLSVLLGELVEADRPRRRVRTMTWFYVAMSVLVLVFGLVVDDPAAIGTGIIMLLFTPGVLLCTAVVVGRWP